MAYNNTYRLRRIADIQQLAREHYEPGRHDRSWRVVWRKHIAPVYHIGFRTFMSYMKTNLETIKTNQHE